MPADTARFFSTRDRPILGCTVGDGGFGVSITANAARIVGARNGGMADSAVRKMNRTIIIGTIRAIAAIATGVSTNTARIVGARNGHAVHRAMLDIGGVAITGITAIIISQTADGAATTGSGFQFSALHITAVHHQMGY